jgi:non-ribosomal peptide synthetase-like protein
MVNTSFQFAVPFQAGKGTKPKGERVMTKHLSAVSSDFTTASIPTMYLHELFEAQLSVHGNSLAISGAASLTYEEVEEQANRIAHELRQLGVGPGKLVGLLFHRSELPILAILGVLKAGGGYVPLDLSYPDDRMRYVLTQAEVGVVVCEAKTRHRIDEVFDGEVLVLDEAGDKLAAQPCTRPSRTEIGLEPTDLCYVLFTSGTTGQPKGVMVEHRNAAQFAVAFNEVCETTPADRIFQGFALTFDGSVEEIWMAFSNGATLVVPTIDTPRFGDDLAEFMHSQGVTYFSTVPTMLTTMTKKLPLMRQLVVSGEPCLPELVEVWATPERLMLNVYGPTEATVNTTAFVCKPGKPITIGKPLRGYKVHIFDKDMNPVPQGTKGELYVSGIGVTRGYLKRPDLTEGAYRTRPGDETRYYRAGDVARINDDGEIEFFGRADNQVKIRGYRVELSEIDALLSEQPNIAIAVTKLHRGGDQDALASYVELKDPAQALDRKAVLAGLRSKLPPYMVPTFFEVLGAMPRLVSGKVDRKSLPEPCTPLVDYSELSLPTTEMEEKVADAWRKLFKIEKVGVDQDFFLDLGGHSLLAAQIVALLRNISGLEIAVRDVYAYPKIGSLAAHLERLSAAAAANPKTAKQTGAYLKDALDEIGKFYQIKFRNILNVFGRSKDVHNLSFSDVRVRTHLREELEYHKARNRALGRPVSERPTRFAATVQGLIILTFFFLISWPAAVFVIYVDEILSGQMTLLVGALYLCTFALAVWPLILTLSIAAKWLIIGRYKPGSYPLWGTYYVRWWLVSSLQGLSGIGLFSGTPLMSTYYRLMGAKVGRNCALSTVACSIWDCLKIGDDTSVGTDTQLLGYRIENGYLHIGKIEIGSRCFVGSHSVLGLNVKMEDGARLDDQSLLYDDETISAGEHRLGSPAEIKDVAVPVGDLKRFGSLRKTVFVIAAFVCSILSGVFLLVPPMMGLFYLVVGYQQGWFLAAMLTLFAAVPVFILVMCLWITLLKAIILRRAKPGVYELYSVYHLRYWLAFDLMRLVGSMMLPVFTTIYLPPWMRLLGAKLGKHCELSTMWSFMPELITAGDGTFFADGCILGGYRDFGGRFEIRGNSVGDRSFIGNSAILPTGAIVGDDCLLGVLSSPPSNTEPMPNGSDWLGLPGFRLPNRQKVGGFDNKLTYKPSLSLYVQRAIIDALRILIPAYTSLILSLTGIATLLYVYQTYGFNSMLAVTPFLTIGLALTAVLFVVALKWVVMGTFRPVIKPLWCHYVWLNEMVNGAYESIMAPVTSILFGTPFAGIPLRLIGCKVGRHCYIASNLFSEWDLVEIGNYAAVNEGVILQTHLFEDRVMKSSYLKIGDNCSVGNMAVVLYDTSMNDRAVLGPLSLLMKGEIMPADSKWYGAPTIHR